MLKVREGLKTRLSAEDLVPALLDQLREVPFLEVGQIRLNEEIAGRQIDLVVEARLPGGTTLLVVADVKGSGEPRFARAAVDHLFYLTQRSCPGAYGMFLAPHISPEAATLLEADGFGYLDLAGNCLLSFEHIYVRREGRPSGPVQKRVLRSFYSPKAERILRACLAEPGRMWKLQELAAVAGVSLGQAHNVKTLLLNREWLAAGPPGLQLREPEQLLMAWAANYDFNRSEKHAFHSLQDPGQIEALLAEICAKENLSYAFTGFSGAARLAPHTRYKRVHAYVDPSNLELLASSAGLKPVSSGANVTLLCPYDAGVYYNSQDRNGCVVSPVQLYLDLRSLPGRGEDAAEFLLDTVLRCQW